MQVSICVSCIRFIVYWQWVFRFYIWRICVMQSIVDRMVIPLCPNLMLFVLYVALWVELECFVWYPRIAVWHARFVWWPSTWGTLVCTTNKRFLLVSNTTPYLHCDIVQCVLWNTDAVTPKTAGRPHIHPMSQHRTIGHVCWFHYYPLSPSVRSSPTSIEAIPDRHRQFSTTEQSPDSPSHRPL